MSITPTDFARGIEAMIAHARETGGGRSACCQRGRCATHLAEESENHVSTLHLGRSLALFPETEGQTLTAAATIEVYHAGLRVLGLEPEAFVG